MADPAGPYSQDILTRIYNVHWGGGVIAISNDGNIYYLNHGDNGLAWEDLGTLDFVRPGPDQFLPFPASCSFGNVVDKGPAFVLVGGSGNVTSPGIIMASRDGKTWKRVFTYANPDADTSHGASVWAVVWDEKEQTFYAAGHQSNSFSDRDGFAWMAETDLLFSSPDGFVWSAAGRNEVRITSTSSEPFPPWPEGTAGLLNPHCSERVLDSNGYRVPDGYYGYDKNGLLIQPNKTMSLDYLFGGASVSSGTGVIVSFSGDGDRPPDPPLDPGLSMVTCVATSGGQWIVAGGKYDPSGGNQPPFGGGKSEAAILATDESGKPIWKRLDPPGTNAIIAMCGAS